MIRSMTGFGAASGSVGGALVNVELRSVNHRFFTPTLKLPGRLGAWESEVREVLRRRIGRGHITLFARKERDRARTVRIDAEKFEGYVQELRALHERLGLKKLDVGAILALPGVVTTEQEEDEIAGDVAELLSIVEAAATELIAMREGEGARLAEVLGERLTAIEAMVARLAARAPERLVEQRDRLRRAVRELSEGVAVDEQRLAQEIAILADRLDVHEELDRLRSHIAAFWAAMAEQGSEAVGKRLGFLLQEMQREANTVGSKSADAELQQDVIGLKEELERIREQVENIE
jgi:uncharacterized protein (TIGR00255 family)